MRSLEPARTRRRRQLGKSSSPTPEMDAPALLSCLGGPNATSKKDIQATTAAEIASTQQIIVCTRTTPASANSGARPHQILAAETSEESNRNIPCNNTNYSGKFAIDAVCHDTQTDWLNAVRMQEELDNTLLTLPDMAHGMLLDPLPPLQLLYNERQHHEQEEVVDDDRNMSNSLGELPFWR